MILSRDNLFMSILGLPRGAAKITSTLCEARGQWVSKILCVNLKKGHFGG